MKRNDMLKVLNPILGVLIVNQILTGILSATLSPVLFNIMHRGGGVVLAVVIILHVTLNWNWVKATYFKSAPSTRTQAPQGMNKPKTD